MTPRTIVFTRADGSQVLVVLYDDEQVTLAEREQVGAVWGPPITPTYQSAKRNPWRVTPPTADELGIMAAVLHEESLQANEDE